MGILGFKINANAAVNLKNDFTGGAIQAALGINTQLVNLGPLLPFASPKLKVTASASATIDGKQVIAEITGEVLPKLTATQPVSAAYGLGADPNQAGKWAYVPNNGQFSFSFGGAITMKYKGPKGKLVVKNIPIGA